MAKIKVFLNGGDHSSGRGVGVYTEGLLAALKKLPEIKLTDRDYDLVHFPFFDLFYHTLPSRLSRPTVVTIHDLTPLVMAERYPKGLRGTFNLLRQWYSLRSVSAVITDSENSKKDIQKYFRLSPDKIFVTPLAAAETYHHSLSAAQIAAVKEKYHLPERFVLTLAAGPNPNKNLPALAEVTDRLGIPLVIVGRGLLQKIVKPVHPELIDLVRLQVYNHLHYPGYVSNSDFRAMLHLASLFVQPSLYEGFGLPLLEAMTAGCLIASSNTSSLPEVYHSEALSFNPQSLKSMEKVIHRALHLSPKARSEQIELARRRAKDFSWSKTARLTLAVYQHVLHSHQQLTTSP